MAIGSSRRVRHLAAATAGLVAAAGLSVLAYRHGRVFLRRRRAIRQLQLWCSAGPAHEPVVDFEVPISHGTGEEEPELDAVEVPVGLLFECERLRTAVYEKLGLADDEEVTLVDALRPIFLAATDEDGELGGDGDNLEVHLPWIDLAALAQLTYWYDRRPRSDDDAPPGALKDVQEARQTDAKFGRWTKKVSREKVIYGTVALRTRTRGHLGEQVFRRPAGVDVTRLSTLRRAAALCGHQPLLELVEETMEKLRPRNVARVPLAEVQKHTSNNDLWLLIDGKVYDVTAFLDIHPGGGQLIVDASGRDATSIFERTHGEGLRYSLRLLNQFFIGVCPDADKAEPVEPEKATPEFIDTLRSITGALHTFDEAKATGEAQGMLR